MDYNRSPYVPEWAEPLAKPKLDPVPTREEIVRPSLVLTPLMVLELWKWDAEREKR